MSVLGCPSQYTVELRTRGGRQRVATITGVTGLKWNRILGDTSEAEVTVLPRGRACARALAGAIPWGHEVAIWRDRELVWCGPLVDVPDNGTTVTLSARDVTAWLPRRILRSGYDTVGSPLDLAAIALLVLADAFALDDPDVLRHVEARATGIGAERFVDAETVMADAELAQLAAYGLDWTVTGRRIVLFGRSDVLGYLAALRGSHFAGPLPVVQAGAGTVTRAVVQGGGVRGEAGGVHPVLGLLERLVQASDVVEDADAAALAQALLYTPQMVLAGGEVALTPRAPVAIAELVPGAQATVSGTGAAAVVSAGVQLVKVSVEWVPGGERVSPSFVERADRSGVAP